MTFSLALPAPRGSRPALERSLRGWALTPVPPGSDTVVATLRSSGMLPTLVDGAPSREEALVLRLRRGEAAAVAEVFDLHGRAVRAFARRFVGDDAAADDLLQEVFVALPSVIRRWEERSSLRTFLIGIAVNHARHHVRAAARRRAATERLAAEPGAHGTDPEQDARRRELARALQRALDELPLDQRAAFVLCEVEERTAAEVSVIVGAPEATVRTRLFHARKRLRVALEREGAR